MKGKGETMKKLEIIQDLTKLIQSMDTADQMLHYHPCCRKAKKCTKKYVFFMLHMVSLQFHIGQKIHHKPKSKGQRLRFEGLHTWLFGIWQSQKEEKNRNIAQRINY